MMTAVASGDTGRVKELIAQGTEINFTDRGLSPLAAAIIASHSATARRPTSSWKRVIAL
jgi:hypothetical protein